jgi:hypothetical protein
MRSYFALLMAASIYSAIIARSRHSESFGSLPAVSQNGVWNQYGEPKPAFLSLKKLSAAPNDSATLLERTPMKNSGVHSPRKNMQT